jgi:hypothetical protein
MLMLAIASGIGACGNKKAATPNAAAESNTAQSNTPAQAQPSAVPSPFDTPIVIKDASGKRVLSMAAGGPDATIEFGEEGNGRMLVGRLADKGNRRYQMQGGAAIAEIKSEEDGFKVRTPDGKLLWKVKMKDEKIKISDNEENQNPYVLKDEDDRDGVKVKENETELGHVKFHRDTEKVKVKDAADAVQFESATTRWSAMYGLLLMKRIPETERAIIMAEILVRGR